MIKLMYFFLNDEGNIFFDKGNFSLVSSSIAKYCGFIQLSFYKSSEIIVMQFITGTSV